MMKKSISCFASSILIAIICSDFVYADFLTKIDIKEEWKGWHSHYYEPARLAIYTKDEWKKVWEKVYSGRYPRPELPKIDFDKQMVIVVFMGNFPSGGYSIEITDIIKKEKEIVAVVSEREPPPGSFNAAVITTPYHIAVVEKSPFPVRFYPPISSQFSRFDESDWVDAGFLEKADVFVTSEAENMQADPWKDKPSGFIERHLYDKLTLRKGWYKISTEPSVVVNSGKRVRFCLSIVQDLRWTQSSPLEIKVEKNRLKFLVRIKKYTKIHILDHRPSLWQNNMVLDNLKEGEYDIFVHKTFVGRIKVVQSGQ